MGKLELGLLVGSGEFKLLTLCVIEPELQSCYTLTLSIVGEVSTAKAITKILIDVLLTDLAVADILASLPMLEMLKMALVCFLGRL
jgi:hypothetical protein